MLTLILAKKRRHCATMMHGYVCTLAYLLWLHQLANVWQEKPTEKLNKSYIWQQAVGSKLNQRTDETLRQQSCTIQSEGSNTVATISLQVGDGLEVQASCRCEILLAMALGLRARYFPECLWNLWLRSPNANISFLPQYRFVNEYNHCVVVARCPSSGLPSFSSQNPHKQIANEMVAR